MGPVSATFGLLALSLALAAPAPAAEDAEPALLAAPGKCAEPRRFQESACADCAEASREAEDDGFNVAGPVAPRFSPADVAAPAAPGAAPAPPTLGGFEGRGPCDSPGSGCLGTVAPAPAGPEIPTGGRGRVTVVERPPNPGRPPGRPPKR